MIDQNKYVVLQVSGEEYGVPITYVTSIEKIESITPIPHLPNYVKGMTRARGELVPVIDLGMILYQKPISANDDPKMLVIQTGELALGVVIKEAKEIIDIPPSSIKQLGLIAYQKTTYFSGVANLDSRLISLLDPPVLVRSLEGIKEIQEYMKLQKEQS